MGRNRGYFRNEKQFKRRENVSATQVRRWNIHQLDREHGYCSGLPQTHDNPTTNPVRPDVSDEYVTRDFPDLSFVEKNVFVGESDDWREGRRVVELSVLADGLPGCKMCNNPLSLSHSTMVWGYFEDTIYEYSLPVHKHCTNGEETQTGV